MRNWITIVTAPVVAMVGLAAAFPALGDSLLTPTAMKGGPSVAEKRAKFEVGDIITVVVRESIDASTESGLNTKKESNLESKAGATDNGFLTASTAQGGLNVISPARLPNWKIDLRNKQNTTGNTRRANTLNTTVSCLVTEVMGNGNVAIEGEKQVAVNREDSKLHIAGVVRTRDVTPANTVQSSQVANFKIELRGQGPLWNNQRRGLLTKFLDWFSPF